MTAIKDNYTIFKQSLAEKEHVAGKNKALGHRYTILETKKFSLIKSYSHKTQFNYILRDLKVARTLKGY